MTSSASVLSFPCRIERELQFRDIDMLQHLNNVALIHYLEDARIAYWKMLVNLSQNSGDWEFILGELRCRYHSPGFLGETLVLSLRVDWLSRSSFGHLYRIEDKATGRLIATATSVQVFYDLSSQTARPMPTERKADIARLEGTTIEILEARAKDRKPPAAPME